MKKQSKAATAFRKVLSQKSPKTSGAAHWQETLKKLEDECTYRVSEDLKRVIDAVEPKNLDFVLKSLNIKCPESETEPPSRTSVEEEQPRPTKRAVVNVSYPQPETDVVSEDRESFRKSVCDTIYQRIAEKIEPSPYKIELSEESSESGGESDTSSGSSMEERLTVMTHDEDLVVHPPSPTKGPPKVVLEDLRSPYQKFFTRPKTELEVHIDRHKKEQSFSDRDKLFIDFMAFLNSPDIQLKSDNISLDSLRTLFDIQIQNPSAHAFAADARELAKIPKEIVDLYDDPQSSGRASLHRQILWDMMYEKGEEKKVAFGKSVGKPRPRWNNNTKRRWLVSDSIPWDLVSGRDLWKDLLNTEILDGFAKWLVANPQYDRPKYLEKIGYFKGLEQDASREDPVQLSLRKKRCGEAFYTLANNMKYFIGDNELSYLPRLEELKDPLQNSNQVPGGKDY